MSFCGVWGHDFPIEVYYTTIKKTIDWGLFEWIQAGQKGEMRNVIMLVKKKQKELFLRLFDLYRLRQRNENTDGLCEPNCTNGKLLVQSLWDIVRLIVLETNESDHRGRKRMVVFGTSGISGFQLMENDRWFFFKKSAKCRKLLNKNLIEVFLTQSEAVFVGRTLLPSLCIIAGISGIPC